MAPGLVWKILPPSGFDPQTIQSVASCYTNCAILAHEAKWHTATQVLIFIVAVHGTCKAPWSSGKVKSQHGKFKVLDMMNYEDQWLVGYHALHDIKV